MRRYNPKEIEPKWQKVWVETDIYRATEDKSKPKRYVLEYFPYPSGAAMHVGHVRNYTIGDVVSRAMRMQGFNVLHPMGWDAFGLPAENYAIKTGISPQAAISKFIDRSRQQLMSMGFSYDWSREINSTDPDYYKWTQWFFLFLFKQGLAYQKEALVNWDPVDKTVLANEQVIDGRAERSGALVEKKPLKQWFFKITDYADRLDKDLDKVNWSEAIKVQQRNWIGRSSGAEIDFTVESSKHKIKVFTTRIDTIFGATFLVLAPEHPLALEITSKEHVQIVKNYISQTGRKSEVERMENREKTGVPTGFHAINPATDEKIPIWIADYILPGYGTGAIMAVPAHDERDFEFATKFGLPIKPVVLPDFGDSVPDEEYVEGVVVIPYDPKTKKYLALDKWANGVGMVGGGIEKGESFEECAQRELFEETGIKQVKKWIKLGEPVYSHYFNNLKNKNKRSYGVGYLAIVDSGQDTSLKAPEEHESFEPAWMDMDSVISGIEKLRPSKGAGGVDHWIEMGRRAEAAVAAYENDKEYNSKPYEGEGILINSEKFDEMTSFEAREKILSGLVKMGTAKEKVNYKIRDWLISRQRYWGAPIPIIHCPKHGAVPVPEKDLPVVLPLVEDYQPSDDGRSSLARVKDFVNTTCPVCGEPAQRETDTMDGFACSSWYFLRFADPHNDEEPFDKTKAEFWCPVDDYIGGAEHAVMHLLFARFWTKVMFDQKMISFDEPFTTLRNHGMILAPDGQKMSKSKNNTIEPDSLIADGYGADSIRLMELFIGPWNQAASWSVEGLAGMYRFLQRLWILVMEFNEADKAEAGHNNETELSIAKAVDKAAKKVTEDITNFSFNTAIAALMGSLNDLYKLKNTQSFSVAQEAWSNSLQKLIQLVAPFAPHITEELWREMGNVSSVHITSWPSWNEEIIKEDLLTLAVQINGRVRAEILVDAGISEKDAIEAAKTDPYVAPHLEGKTVSKAIYITDRLVSLVVK